MAFIPLIIEPISKLISDAITPPGSFVSITNNSEATIQADVTTELFGLSAGKTINPGSQEVFTVKHEAGRYCVNITWNGKLWWSILNKPQSDTFLSVDAFQQMTMSTVDGTGTLECPVGCGVTEAKLYVSKKK